MRTLFEIIDAAKIGEATTHQECFYALLVCESLSYFDLESLRQFAFEQPKFRTLESAAEQSFKRWKLALEKSPKDWLGPNNDPTNEECRRRVKMSRRLFEILKTKVINEKSQS
jgi:hypothetical protein